MLRAHASRVATGSVLTPSTWASYRSNSERLSSYEGICALQTGVNAADPAAFFAQDLNALDRLTTEFARTLVSAILEAF